MPFDLAPGAATWLVLVFFGAAYVRGYCGFGFAALVLTGAGLVIDPVPLIATIIVADLAMTLGQWRGIRAGIEWRRLGLLLLGALPSVPLGVAVMSRLDPDGARIAISLVILTLCAVIWRGWRLVRPGRAAHVGAGLASGLAQGAGVGGLPVAAFFAAADLPAVVFRATIIAYFTLLDLWSLPNLAWRGLVTEDALWLSVGAVPVCLLGVLAGGHRFAGASPESFRRIAVILLAGLAALGLARALA
ncbi:sulfite exporter TauE/SafE family protein [Wenxinia saemankumensis]|uniref:Probable membrane transporter protein n=1 Tax=Wenxinia saemankumensis TaxID=1447782 RepID=A0A1M6E5N9_9RHOB|nr:sulfite exporter TauE/SafE family protein [Wenxinia saemankumensis]SHI80689.1 hypothetical protein SAMN05444417_1813 [Wenxinia saemankumensis]